MAGYAKMEYINTSGNCQIESMRNYGCAVKKGGLAADWYGLPLFWLDSYFVAQFSSILWFVSCESIFHSWFHRPVISFHLILIGLCHPAERFNNLLPEVLLTAVWKSGCSGISLANSIGPGKLVCEHTTFVLCSKFSGNHPEVLADLFLTHEDRFDFARRFTSWLSVSYLYLHTNSRIIFPFAL